MHARSLPLPASFTAPSLSLSLSLSPRSLQPPCPVAPLAPTLQRASAPSSSHTWPPSRAPAAGSSSTSRRQHARWPECVAHPGRHTMLAAAAALFAVLSRSNSFKRPCFGAGAPAAAPPPSGDAACTGSPPPLLPQPSSSLLHAHTLLLHWHGTDPPKFIHTLHRPSALALSSAGLCTRLPLCVSVLVQLTHTPL